MTRPSYVDPSALSPSEHEAYSGWRDELEVQLKRVSGRPAGLRFGEMLAFVRKRTVVDRESEIMSFLSPAQQQNLGAGEFIAILRLLAHARTCATLTRDHMFIQTSPLVLTTPLPSTANNPFFQTASWEEKERPRPPPKRLTTSNLQEVAAAKKRAPAPPPPSAPHSLSRASSSTAEIGNRASPLTPLAGSNPFRQLLSESESRQQPLSGSVKPSNASFSSHTSVNLPPTPPESTFTAKSPPLPPRPSAKPTDFVPKHTPPSQPYQKINDPHATPTTIRPYSVPAVGPTSIDIISSSTVQPQHTGQSNASSNTTRLVHQNTGGNRKSTNFSSAAGTLNLLTDGNVRLLGSSHIGINSMRLRTSPSPGPVASMGRNNSSSSEESNAAMLMIHKNRSDSSLSSLSGMLPKGGPGRRGVTATTSSLSYASEAKDEPATETGKDGYESEEILSSEYTAKASDHHHHHHHLARSKTMSSSSSSRAKPPLPPLPRRRPESLYVSTDPISRSQKLVFGAEPTTAHPSPFHATSINTSSHYGNKARTNSAPGHQISSHGRSTSLSSTSSLSGSRHANAGGPSGSARASRQYHSESLHRQASMNSGNGGSKRPIDLFNKGKDVSQEWLEKARAGMKDVAQQSVAKRSPREDRQILMQERGKGEAEVAVRGRGEDDEDDDEDGEAASDDEDQTQHRKSVQERRRELERLRTEVEPGWSRLD